MSAEPEGIVDEVAAPTVVLPGDVITVRVLSIETTETAGLVVGADGDVSLPLGGRLHVGGKTIAEAEAAAQRAIRELDHFARVTLHVSDPAGHRVTVVGAVEHPGTIALKSDLRFAEALAAAGGPRMGDSDGQIVELADVEGARLVRDGRALSVSLSKALEGDPRHNVHLLSGDHVWVPPARGRLVSILGSVKTARTIAAIPGLRLSTALAMAGGATREADEADVRVVRGPLSRPKVYRASLSGLVSGREPDVELAAGDVVYVSEHWFATTADVIQRITPLLVSATLAAALAR